MTLGISSNSPLMDSFAQLVVKGSQSWDQFGSP